MQAFLRVMLAAPYQVHTRVRQEKGQDIAGACGQVQAIAVHCML